MNDAPQPESTPTNPSMSMSPRTPAATSGSTTAPASAPVPESASGSAHSAAHASRPTAVLPSDERDKLQLRLQHAVNGFVDEPRPAVEEAGAVLDDLADRISELIEERRNTLRGSRQDATGESGTEDLRVVLRGYRDLAERLLRL